MIFKYITNFFKKNPFVYEKIGSHIEHIMIDEFQDTSVTQWDNFKPLIKESLSHGTTLIVGDPKQSIYRFRNGDWRILGEIKDSCDLGSLTQVKTLDTNWRSEKVVVEEEEVSVEKLLESIPEAPLEDLEVETKSETRNQSY